MSFRDCIDRGVAGGEIDPKRAEQIVEQYEQMFREFENTMGPSAADYHAARHIVDRARREAKERRRVQQLQAAVTTRNLQAMETYQNRRGELDPGRFVQDKISNKRGTGVSTLEGKYEVIRRQFRRDLTDMVRQFSGNLVGGRRNTETLNNVVRELFGEGTGDEMASAIAQAWTRTSERARTRYNAAGGHIGSRADWGLPQMHDSNRVRMAAGKGVRSTEAHYTAWRDFILPKLDLEKMGRDFNDGVPFTPETLEILMRDSFEAIRTDGYSRRSPSSRHGSAMYNRRADHRFFSFKSGNDWMEYNARFGSGRDPFRVMIGHLDNMANDIASMEELGPNPIAGYQYLKDAAQSLAARSDDPRAPAVVERRVRFADDMFDLYTGASNIPGNAAFAKGASALRQYLTSAHLGSAIWSSFTDFNTQRIGARFVGMRSAGFMVQLQRLARSPEFRADANRAGLIFENAVEAGNAAARYEMENIHIEVAGRMADFTIRASGLGHLTELQRHAFGMEFMSSVASRWRGKAFGDLEARTRRVFERYGIGEREWAIINETPAHRTSNGLEIVRAQEIEERGFQDVADRYMEMIVNLTEFAVPSNDIRGRPWSCLARPLARSRASWRGRSCSSRRSRSRSSQRRSVGSPTRWRPRAMGLPSDTRRTSSSAPRFSAPWRSR